jgi:AmiR/NasT family two-component response regulator
MTNPASRDGDGRVGLELAQTSEVARLVELTRSLAERNAQLQQALESRIVIEQAKGVLVERFGIPPDQAFELLRRASRNHRVRIHVLAGDVVGSRVTPLAIQELVG